MLESQINVYGVLFIDFEGFYLYCEKFRLYLLLPTASSKRQRRVQNRRTNVLLIDKRFIIYGA